MAEVSDPYAQDDDNVDGLVEEMGEHERDERRAAPATGPSNRDDEFEFDSEDTADEFEVEAKREPRAREQRRQERGGFQEAYKGAREDNDRLRREIGDLRAGQERGRDDDRGDHAKGEYDRNLKSARDERVRLIDTYNRAQTTGSLSEAEAGKMREDAWDMDQKIARLNNDEWARLREPSQSQRDQDALGATLKARAPDIYSNRAAQSLLMAKYQVKKAQGHRDSLELHDRCAEEVRDEMGLRRDDDRPEPTDRERAQLTGMPRGGTRGGRRTRSDPRRYKMNDSDRAMADVSHSHIKNANKRYQTWVNEVRPDITD